MKNNIVYIAVIHQARIAFPCGIVSDMSDKNKAKLVEYILYQTGIEFSGLMTVDLNSTLVLIVYADGSDDIYIYHYILPIYFNSSLSAIIDVQPTHSKQNKFWY